MNRDFAIAEVPTGKLNALVKNMMVQMRTDDPVEAIRRVNSGEWVISQLPWKNTADTIHFSVTSDGTSGFSWMCHFQNAKGGGADHSASVFLSSEDFKETTGIVSHITVLKGSSFHECTLSSSRRDEIIYHRAARLNLSKPTPELACLIRHKFSNKEIKAMGFSHIIIMSEFMDKVDGVPKFLRVGTYGLSSNQTKVLWPRDYGFAFVASQHRAPPVSNY